MQDKAKQEQEIMQAAAVMRTKLAEMRTAREFIELMHRCGAPVDKLEWTIPTFDDCQG